MDETKQKIVSLKNVTDGQCLTLKGPGEFRIGLTAEDKVVSVPVPKENSSSNHHHLHHSPQDEIIVPLVNLTVWKTEGTTVAPASRDLPCLVNDEALSSEANLLSGSVIEVGDKQLEFSDGPLARPRRCLPPTPGVPLLPQPPPKPERHSTGNILQPLPDTGVTVLRTRPLSLRKPPPLPSDWAMIELPSTDAELLKKTKKPEQLASLAAGYITKHIHLHTDARITAELTDQIFSAMLEVAHHRRSILQRFLTDLIEDQANTGADDDTAPEPSHGALIILLREILRQFLDPQSLVLVSLVMLRALSHVPGATQLLVDCEVSSAVLGTMAALKSAATVQQFCLDVLAKVALYQPTIDQKAPLRESATDLVCMALECHPKSVSIAQAACRCLANLATTLYNAVGSKLDSNFAPSTELDRFVSGLLAVLDYLFTKSKPAVHTALSCHGQDLTIKTDGRRFLFIYAKLDQLKQRKEQWLITPPEPPPPIPKRSQNKPPPPRPASESDEETRGIMKRSRSFENLRSPERKVTFDGDSEPEDRTPSSSPSPNPERPEPLAGGGNYVEVLAQRVIPVPPFRDSSPDTPTQTKTLIGHGMSDSTHQELMGSRPDAEGSDSPFNHSVEYENWDLLRGVLRKKSGLKGHPYSAEDLQFMTLLTKTQVVALVCALAVDGEVGEALKAVDRPISDMLLKSEVAPGVRDFVAYKYSSEDSLMDLDPGLMVSIIDAVRYKSLSFEKAQKCVLGVVQALNGEQQAPVVAVTVEFLASTITNKSLAPAMTVATFVQEVCRELERARKVSRNAPALDSLLAEIKLCANKSVL